MKVFLFLVAMAVSGVASAQQGKRHEGGKQQQMRQEDRQRLREDMNQVYRDRDRGRDARPERQGRPMSPEQREKLRQDVQDANRQMKR
jgi:hypothetical protein